MPIGEDSVPWGEVSTGLTAQVAHASVYRSLFGEDWLTQIAGGSTEVMTPKQRLNKASAMWIARHLELTQRKSVRLYGGNDQLVAACDSPTKFIKQPQRVTCMFRACPFCWMRAVAYRVVPRFSQLISGDAAAAYRELVCIRFRRFGPLTGIRDLLSARDEESTLQKKIFCGPELKLASRSRLFIAADKNWSEDDEGSFEYRYLAWVSQATAVTLKSLCRDLTKSIDAELHLYSDRDIAIDEQSKKLAYVYSRFCEYPASWITGLPNRTRDILNWVSQSKMRTIDFSGPVKACNGGIT